jgi:Cu(I)/Ag(I) efflux system membrane protein CusA/SilA
VVGLLALAGLAAEMALLLLSALHRHAQASTEAQTILRQAFEAALERRRAVLMTSSSTALALAPILVSDGAGADLLQRIAAPMLGGLITTVAAVLLLLPALWMMGRNRAGRTGA